MNLLQQCYRIRLREKYEDNQDIRDYAIDAHRGHVRRSTGEPYSNHPLSVEKILDAYGAPDLVLKAALAHDILEDEEEKGYTEEKIREDLGDDVADLVVEVSNIPLEVKKMGKKGYMNQKLCNCSENALWIKMGDIISNSTTDPKPEQKERMRDNVIFLIRYRNEFPENENLVDLIKTACNFLNIDFDDEYDYR